MPAPADLTPLLPAAKDIVRDVLEQMPDDCTIEDIMYRLYVIQSIQRGLADVAAGNLIPHADAMNELRLKWTVEP